MAAETKEKMAPANITEAATDSPGMYCHLCLLLIG
jgi:hypothetical protein